MVISVVELLGLHPVDKPGSVRPDGSHLSWQLTVTPELLNSAGTLWGGAGWGCRRSSPLPSAGSAGAASGPPSNI